MSDNLSLINQVYVALAPKGVSRDAVAKLDDTTLQEILGKITTGEELEEIIGYAIEKAPDLADPETLQKNREIREENGKTIIDEKNGDELAQRTIIEKDGDNIIETVIIYSNGKPSSKTVKKNGNTQETSTYSSSVGNSDNNDSSVCITTTSSDGSTIITAVSGVDENGQYNDEQFEEQQIIKLSGEQVVITKQKDYIKVETTGTDGHSTIEAFNGTSFSRYIKGELEPSSTVKINSDQSSSGNASLVNLTSLVDQEAYQTFMFSERIADNASGTSFVPHSINVNALSPEMSTLIESLNSKQFGRLDMHSFEGYKRPAFKKLFEYFDLNKNGAIETRFSDAKENTEVKALMDIVTNIAYTGDGTPNKDGLSLDAANYVVGQLGLDVTGQDLLDFCSIAIKEIKPLDSKKPFKAYQNNDGTYNVYTYYQDGTTGCELYSKDGKLLSFVMPTTNTEVYTKESGNYISRYGDSTNNDIRYMNAYMYVSDELHTQNANAAKGTIIDESGEAIKTIDDFFDDAGLFTNLAMCLSSSDEEMEKMRKELSELQSALKENQSNPLTTSDRGALQQYVTYSNWYSRVSSYRTAIKTVELAETAAFDKNNAFNQAYGLYFMQCGDEAKSKQLAQALIDRITPIYNKEKEKFDEINMDVNISGDAKKVMEDSFHAKVTDAWHEMIREEFTSLKNDLNTKYKNSFANSQICPGAKTWVQWSALKGIAINDGETLTDAEAEEHFKKLEDLFGQSYEGAFGRKNPMLEIAKNIENLQETSGKLQLFTEIVVGTLLCMMIPAGAGFLASGAMQVLAFTAAGTGVDMLEAVTSKNGLTREKMEDIISARISNIPMLAFGTFVGGPLAHKAGKFFNELGLDDVIADLSRKGPIDAKTFMKAVSNNNKAMSLCASFATETAAFTGYEMVTTGESLETALKNNIGMMGMMRAFGYGAGIVTGQAFRAHKMQKRMAKAAEDAGINQWKISRSGDSYTLHDANNNVLGQFASANEMYVYINNRIGSYVKFEEEAKELYKKTDEVDGQKLYEEVYGHKIENSDFLTNLHVKKLVENGNTKFMAKIDGKEVFFNSFEEVMDRCNYELSVESQTKTTNDLFGEKHIVTGKDIFESLNPEIKDQELSFLENTVVEQVADGYNIQINGKTTHVKSHTELVRMINNIANNDVISQKMTKYFSDIQENQTVYFSQFQTLMKTECKINDIIKPEVAQDIIIKKVVNGNNISYEISYKNGEKVIAKSIAEIIDIARKIEANPEKYKETTDLGPDMEVSDEEEIFECSNAILEFNDGSTYAINPEDKVTIDNEGNIFVQVNGEGDLIRIGNKADVEHIKPNRKTELTLKTIEDNLSKRNTEFLNSIDNDLSTVTESEIPQKHRSAWNLINSEFKQIITKSVDFTLDTLELTLKTCKKTISLIDNIISESPSLKNKLDIIKNTIKDYYNKTINILKNMLEELPIVERISEGKKNARQAIEHILQIEESDASMLTQGYNYIKTNTKAFIEKGRNLYNNPEFQSVINKLLEHYEETGHPLYQTMSDICSNKNIAEIYQILIEQAGCGPTKLSQIISNMTNLMDTIGKVDPNLRLAIENTRSNCNPTRTLDEAQWDIDMAFNNGNKYKVLKLMGVASMGETYLVERTDGTKAVLKMLKRGIDETQLKLEEEFYTILISTFNENPAIARRQIDIIHESYSEWAKELDFYQEFESNHRLATGAKRYRVANATDISSDGKCLIMDLADGVQMNKLMEMLKFYKENPAEYSTKYAKEISENSWLGNPENILENLPKVLTQTFSEQFLFMKKGGQTLMHGDPHMGNYFITVDEAGNFIPEFIDTGLCIERDGAAIKNDVRFFANYAVGNTDIIAEYFVDKCDLGNNNRDLAIKAISADLKEEVFNQHINITDFGKLQKVITNILERHGLLMKSTETIGMKAELQFLSGIAELYHLNGQSFKINEILKDGHNILYRMFKNRVNPFSQMKGALSFAYHNQVQSSSTLLQFFSKKSAKNTSFKNDELELPAEKIAENSGISVEKVRAGDITDGELLLNSSNFDGAELLDATNTGIDMRTFTAADIEAMRGRGEKITVQNDIVYKFDPATKKNVEIGRTSELNLSDDGNSYSVFGDWLKNLFNPGNKMTKPVPFDEGYIKMSDKEVGGSTILLNLMNDEKKKNHQSDLLDLYHQMMSIHDETVKEHVEYILQNGEFIGKNIMDAQALVDGISAIEGKSYSIRSSYNQGMKEPSYEFALYLRKLGVSLEDLIQGKKALPLEVKQYISTILYDFRSASRFERINEFIKANPQSPMSNYLYENYYLESLKNEGIDYRIIDKCIQINNRFNVKINISHDTRFAMETLEAIEKELDAWHRASNGRAKMPPLFDFNTAKSDWYDTSRAYGQGPASGYSEIYSFNGAQAYARQTPEIIRWAMRHEMTHTNDLKKGYIDSKCNLPEIIPAINREQPINIQIERLKLGKYYDELKRAGLNDSKILYGYTNTLEYIAVASEGNLKAYSPEFRQVLIDFGMPEWMFNLDC